jgi:cycloeucalenol cycloisomerase
MANKTAPANETKALVERAWLWYTPVWCAVTGGIMVGGWANEAMGDAALFLFGLSMAVGLCAAPFAYRRWTKRGAATALDGRVVWAMIAANVVLSFGMNYFQTPFFFDVLHMHYGFKTTWRIERNPVFLYLLTMPYFATYTVCCCRTARLISRSVRVSWLRRLLLCLLPFTFAFIETLTHVNPLTEQIFCYDDLGLALTFGTACYGIAFAIAMPLWMWIGGVPEGRNRRGAPVKAAAAMAAGVLLDTVIIYAIWTHIAPLVTTVVDNSPPGGGCLVKGH